MPECVCPLCDEVCENPEGECPEEFACKECRESHAAEQALWAATDWSGEVERAWPPLPPIDLDEIL